jgi:hypothetical protein
MLYGMPRDYHRWDGNRFVLAPMPQQGLIPSVRPEASPEIQQQAAVSRSTTLGAPDTGNGDRGFSAPNNGGQGMGNVSLASLAPDKAGLASMAGGLVGGIGGTITGLAGSALGGLAAGMGPGRTTGGLGGAGLGFLAGGPIGAALVGAIGGGIGNAYDRQADRDATFSAMGDMGLAYDPAYAADHTARAMAEMTSKDFGVPGGGSGLGGISPGTGGAMSTTADGTVAGYGALGTPSGGDSGGGSSKIVCTAMCQAYGFGSFRQRLWLDWAKGKAPEYQTGYHLLFKPWVRYAYGGKTLPRRILRVVGEHIARHRTADIWQQKRGKRDWIGATERFVLEPLCYAVGWLSAGAKRVSHGRD